MKDGNTRQKKGGGGEVIYYFLKLGMKSTSQKGPTVIFPWDRIYEEVQGGIFNTSIFSPQIICTKVHTLVSDIGMSNFFEL